jgi:hypothetical protein
VSANPAVADARTDPDRTHRRYRYRPDPDRNLSKWPAMILYCAERNGWALPGGRFTRSKEVAEQVAARVADLMWDNMRLRPEIFKAQK